MRIDPISWILLPLSLLWLALVGATATGSMIIAVDRQEPLRPTLPWIAMVAREAGARMLFWLSRPIGWIASHPVQTPDNNREGMRNSDGRSRNPVLLIAGNRENRAAMAMLRTYLGARGFSWVWAVDSEHTLGLEAAAGALAAHAKTLRDASGAEGIDLVAHGTGGLVAAWFARHLDVDGTAKRLVTIGTPWGGTRTSIFEASPVREEIAYGAALLDGLVPDIPTHSIYSSDDPIVVPADSAAPEGVQTFEVPWAGHAEMLLSARVFRAVEAALH